MCSELEHSHSLDYAIAEQTINCFWVRDIYHDKNKRVKLWWNVLPNGANLQFFEQITFNGNTRMILTVILYARYQHKIGFEDNQIQLEQNANYW